MRPWKQCVLFAVLLFLFLLYSPTLLDFNPAAYNIPFPPLVGPLAINNRLDETEQLFKNKIHGPESIVFHKGALYTGTEDGHIMKIVGNKLIPLARLGRECQIPWEEHLCGRPLGLRIGRDSLLYITDAYYGIHSMNFSTGILTRLLSTSATVEGMNIKFPDDMDIDDEGNVYISDASTKWDLSEIYYLMTENEGSGRILKFNFHTGKLEVLIRNLHFPNGVQLSHDGKSLLICEISNRRVIRYYIKGPKEGQQDVFIDELPAEPDNIRLSPRGGYWLALTSVRNNTHQLFVDRVNEYPLIKKIWARAQHALGSVLMAITEVWPSPVLKEFAYKVKRGDIVLPFLWRHGMILELDADGKIIRSLQSPDGRIADLSQVTEHEGYLYLGSFVNNYLGRLKL